MNTHERVAQRHRREQLRGAIESITQQPEPQVVVIDAHDDAAYTHGCGAYVSPHFTGSGITAICPRCGKTA